MMALEPLGGSIVDEPQNLGACHVVDIRTGDFALGIAKNIVENVLLAGTGSNKGDMRRVLNDGQGECDAARRGLGRVLHTSNPGRHLIQHRVLWKKGARVAILPAAQEQQVESGEANSIGTRENADKLLLVLVSKLLQRIFVLQSREKGSVDRVDLFTWDAGGRQLAEKSFVYLLEVAIVILEWHRTLVRKENMPLCK